MNKELTLTEKGDCLMRRDHRIRSSRGINMLAEVRKSCLTLPEVEESLDGFGCTTFKVNGKSFVRMSETEEKVRLSFKCDLFNQEILLQDNRFFKAPYVGHQGWVSVNTYFPIHWGEIGDLLKGAYLRAAPEHLVKRSLNPS